MLVQMSPKSALAPASRDLAAEANHRIANHLSVIGGLVRAQSSVLDNHGAQIPAADVRQILEETRARINAVSRLHRLLASRSNGEPIDLGGYLGEIAESLVESLSARSRIRLRTHFEPTCRLAPESALHLGLIVVELVTNSIKYAHPAGVSGWIGLSCHRSPEGKLVVQVSDDGVGLPETFDTDGTGHLGLDLVSKMVAHLGATIAFENDGLGLKCVIEMPLAAAA